MNVKHVIITIVWEKFTVGIFHVKKFHVKIFSYSWVKYAHILPYCIRGTFGGDFNLAVWRC